SQETLAKGTEQSVDTVQRNLKRLALDGHITIARRPRARGRWPSLCYQLNMFEPATACDVEARSLNESKPTRVKRNETQCNAQEPDPGSVRRGHAARCTSAAPQALRYEASEEYL